MNAEQWEKLRKNWSDLLDQRPDDLIGTLYQKNILSKYDCEHIRGFPSNYKRMEALLHILKAKPAQTNCFSEFMSALKSESPWLAEKINDTKTTSDPSVTALEDPSSLDGEASSVLRKCCKSQRKSQTSLEDIRICLENNGVFKDNCKWTNKKLINFVKEEFVGVVFVKKSNLFINLEINAMEHSLQTFDSLSKTTLASSDQFGLPSKVKAPRVCLAPYHQSERKRNTWVNLHLSTERTTAQCRVERQMKFHVNSDIEIPYMKLLNFQSLVEPSDAYILGYRLSLPCINKRSKLLPIKNFLTPNVAVGLNIYYYVALEVMKFTAACLNDRQNGTVYFGVRSAKNVHSLEAEIVGVQLAKKKLDKFLNLLLMRSFTCKFRDIVKETIRAPRFVPVDSQDGCSTDLFVVEFDVVPDSQIVDSNIFWTKFNGRIKTNNLYTFSKFGLPVPVELNKFKKNIKIHMEARKKEETKIGQSAVDRCNEIFVSSAGFLFAAFLLIYRFFVRMTMTSKMLLKTCYPY